MELLSKGVFEMRVVLHCCTAALETNLCDMSDEVRECLIQHFEIHCLCFDRLRIKISTEVETYDSQDPYYKLTKHDEMNQWHHHGFGSIIPSEFHDSSCVAH